jgi:trigger factor
LVKTEVKELPESRVRVEAEIEPGELRARVEAAARGLGRELRIPGFRKGKVPPEMVVQRLGWEAVLQSALEQALPEWYERALADAEVTAVGEPKLDVAALPSDGEPLTFSIEVGVRPKATLGDYRGLEVGKAEAEVPDEAIQAELDRLREGFATLDPVERQARQGDFVLVDFRGEVDGRPVPGGEGRDYLLELGAGRVIEGLEEGLVGARAGEERQVNARLPQAEGEAEAESMAGKEATFAVKVKSVREKHLPNLDDEFASEASEFDTLGELRADLQDKLRKLIDQRLEGEFREAALDAAAERATVEVPDELAAARAAEMWDRLERSLEARGVSAARYLELQGKTREQVLADAATEAERALRREAVLEAVADAEGIAATDEEMVDALAHAASHEGVEPAQLLERLRSTGRDAYLREDVRMRKALDVIADAAKPIPLERAAAREALWTPDKERPEEGPGLWTPGQGPPEAAPPPSKQS